MTTDIQTEAQRDIRLDHLLGTFAVGSALWSWQDEYDDLMKRDTTEMEVLIASIRADGIREPILLGSDGRVWDGHHRICAAMHLGLDTMPVEFCSPPSVTPTREQIGEVLAGGERRFWEYPNNDYDRERYMKTADAVLALMQKLAEKRGVRVMTPAEVERAAAEKAWNRCVGEMPIDLDWKNYYGDNNPYRREETE